MNRTLLTIGSIVVLGALLSACGGGGGGGSTTTITPPAARFEAQFGGNFATAFGAPNNSEPQPVAAGDAIPVSLTAEPVPLPGT